MPRYSRHGNYRRPSLSGTAERVQQLTNKKDADAPQTAKPATRARYTTEAARQLAAKPSYRTRSRADFRKNLRAGVWIGILVVAATLAAEFIFGR